MPCENILLSFKNVSQAKIGGPRGIVSKMDVGEKQINCSALDAKQWNCKVKLLLKIIACWDMCEFIELFASGIPPRW